MADEVEQLGRLLDACAQRGLTVTSARVGEVEIGLVPTFRPVGPTELADDPDDATVEEEHATYGAAEGGVPHWDPAEFAALTREVG